jgi:DNA-binding transcriptional ArsR family regulator
MDEALRAVADPIRRRILSVLRVSPQPAGRIAAGFSVSRPAVSRHLRVLREAGLVRDEESGRERLYSLELAPLLRVSEWLVDMTAPCDAQRSGWERRFMALETEVHRVRSRSRSAIRPNIPSKRRKTT